MINRRGYFSFGPLITLLQAFVVGIVCELAHLRPGILMLIVLINFSLTVSAAAAFKRETNE